MTETVKGWGQAVADNLNPFTRVVTAATTEDGSTTVPYYQQEKVKEATLQSDYGCDCVFKAIMVRLDSYSPAVKCKTLHLIRALMLEGPSTFNAKISSNVGKFISMATAHQDARKDTIEKQLGLLAQTIHQASQGDRGALHRAVGEADATRQLAGQEDAGKSSRAKSDYQEAQEREAKAYRKKRKEELRGRDVIVQDKAFEQFDQTLTATKMVSSAVHSTKKKHAPQELNNFTGAAVEHAKTSDVMAALDAVLRDLKEPVQNKFKALMIIDYMVTEHPVAEAIAYFKANTNGLNRIVNGLAQDATPKAQQMVQTAQSLLQQLPTAAVPEARSRSSSINSAGGAAVPAPVAAAPPQQQHHNPAPQPLLGSQNINAAFGGGPAVDTMFGAMEVRKTRARGNSGAGAPPQQQQQAGGGFGSGDGGWGSQPSADNSWGGGFDSAPAAQPTAQPTAGGRSGFESPATWGSASQASPNTIQQHAASPVAAPQQQQQQAQATSAEEQLRQMQEAFQANMQQMMAAAAAGAPQQPPQQAPAQAVAPQRSASVATASSTGDVAPGPRHADPAGGGGQAAAPVWGSSVLAPPPIPASNDGDAGAGAQDNLSPSSSQRAVAPDPASNPTPTQQPDASAGASPTQPGDVSFASPAVRTPAAGLMPEPATSTPFMPSPMPPTATTPAQQQQQPRVTIEMMQKLQEQMQATQAMLQRQQQMLTQMQALYMQQQQAEMMRLSGGGGGSA
jgi:hypothetical protein